MTEIYGIMYGAKCAAIGFITNKSISSSTTVNAYVKKSGDSSFTTVTGVLNTTFKFMQSAWEFDIRNLDEGSTYEVYVSVAGEESNHLSFTTLSDRGSFNYDSRFWNYRNSAEYTPSQSVQDAANEALDTFTSTLEDVGYTNTELTKYYLTSASGFSYGGLTSGNKQYILIDGVTVDRMIQVMIHEYRHRIFFGKYLPIQGNDCWGVGYASEKTAYFGSYLNNLYEVASFFSRNDDKTELYYYYGENSCPETFFLSGFFLIKILGKQEVNIVYKQ